MTSVLLDVSVEPDPERNRVALRISRSDQDSVLVGLLTRDDAWRIARELIRAAGELGE